MALLQDKEILGLEEMQRLTAEFLQETVENEENQQVRKFLQEADEEPKVMFLKGRKYQPKYAWETKYAEAKLVKHPELFAEELSSSMAYLRDNPPYIVLKQRDSLQRRIFAFDSGKWNVSRCSLLDIVSCGIRYMEGLLRDEDCMKNGLVIVQDSSGLGFAHCRQYTISTCRLIVDIFWHTYPMQIKAVYFVNTPYLLSCALALVRVFFPKKLKERMLISSTDRNFEDLHKAIPPNTLPEFLGGSLNWNEACDSSLVVN